MGMGRYDKAVHWYVPAPLA